MAIFGDEFMDVLRRKQKGVSNSWMERFAGAVFRRALSRTSRGWDGQLGAF
jgi:hypothetical protein